MRKQIRGKTIQMISLMLGITAVLVISGCSSSGSIGYDGGNTPVTNSSAITIDNAGTIPIFGNSSTSTVVYVHNNGTQTISGITYTAKLNNAKISSALSAQLTKLLQINKNLTGVIGEQCSTIAAGQSCPLSITTPLLSGSNPQGSMLISASYKYNDKDNTFSQIINYAQIQNNQLAAGAIFQAGANISGFGNSVGYATIYLYGSGHNQVYDVSSMTINKPAVTIINGNISGHQIQSNFVQAVEVSSPILSSSLSATITVKSSAAQNKSTPAVKIAKSTNNVLQTTNEFISSVDLSVEPTSSGAILTTGLVPLINTATSTSGSMLVLNSGNEPAQIGSVSAGSGISNLSGCSNSTLATGDSCNITFSVSEAGGSANITVPYSGGSASSVVGNVTWYNGVGAPLVSMSAANNPLTFPATVGGSTTVTVTNVGGYTLEEVSIPTPVVVGGSATASVSSNTCTSSLAINASCSYVVTVADSATDLNQQINLGFIASYAGSSGSQSYSRVMPLSYSSTSYGAIISIDPSSASLTITGNNNESTTQVLTISNSGNVPANISRALSDNPTYLSESASSCGATLNAESSCTVILQFGPTYSADGSSGSSIYTVNYTAAGQTPPGSVSSTIDWTVQSYVQGISLTNHSALGSTSGNGETSETQYNFTALGRDQVITKSITLTYTNTGTNSMKITGIQDGNSPYTWQVGGNGTTCTPGITLAPADTCKIVYDSVFESNILALRNVGTTYTENLTVPTLIYQDAVNSNIQFSAQPNLPTGGVTVYAQSNQATLANSVTVNELGTPYESVTISHLLANADDSLYVTVTSKMEDYFVTIPTLGDPTGCSYSSANGLITQTCIMGKNDPSLSVTYMVNQSLLNNDSDLTLTVLFSTDNLSQIVAMNQIYATVNLGKSLVYAYVVDAGTVAGGITQCVVNRITGLLGGCNLAVDGGFSRPRQIANYLNYLYVTSATGSISKCELLSSGISSCADAGSGLSYVNGIAISNYNAYTTSVVNGVSTIQKCTVSTTTGNLQPCVAAETFNEGFSLAGMTISNGYLYVAGEDDSGDYGIFICTISGIDGSLNACSFNKNSIFKSPNSIAISNGYAYVTNYASEEVIKCTVNANSGVLSNCVVAATGFTEPSGVSIANGFIYITDSAAGINTATVCAISPTGGALSGCTNSGGSNFTGPWGIIVNYPVSG